MNKPYVHSNYERIKDDDYQTIDLRCVAALVESYAIYDTDDIVDCCSPNGSGIIDGLVELGYRAKGIDDAFSNYTADWCVSNPPYTRGLVDKIIWRQINNIRGGDVSGVAMLLRNNFDFAKSRYAMFTHDYYAGQIHMMFRPWWSEEKKAQPIHNYVWHIWKRMKTPHAHPIVIYWKED